MESSRMTMTDQSADLANAAPHEILGLSARERDPVKIVEAASIRLKALDDAGGSEVTVRRSLARLIRAARDTMLAAASQR
jgi:hypothetical protein